VSTFQSTYNLTLYKYSSWQSVRHWWRQYFCW